jgi:hypothetical protein
MIVWYLERIDALRSWWRRLRRYRCFTGLVRLDATADPSAALKTRKLILIGMPTRPKWLRFTCPCRCGRAIALNLMTSHGPCWTIAVDFEDRLSVTPSVDATECGSHFWIRKNHIDWV